MEKNNILIIDDDRTQIFFVETILKSSDLNIFSALTGLEGLEIAKNENIDLILLDISMPDIDGFEIFSKLKNDKFLSEVPIIFITGHNEPNLAAKGLSLGAVDFIKKPFNSAELLQRVNIHMNLRRTKLKLQEELTKRKQIEEELAHKIKKNEIIISELNYSTEKLNEINRKLQDSQKIYDILTDNSPFGIAYIQQKKIKWTNKKFEQLFEIEAFEVIEKNINNIFDETVDIKNIEENINKNFSENRTIEFEALLNTNKNNSFHALITAQIIDNKDINKGSLWLFDNITEKKKIRETIQTKERYLEAISAIQFYLIVFEEYVQFFTIIENLQKPTDADRIYLYKTEKDSENQFIASIIEEVIKENIEPIKDKAEFQYFPFQKYFPRWVKTLSREQIVYGNIEDFSEEEQSILRDFKVKSILIIPLIVNEKFYGFIGFEHITKKKNWTKEEISYLKSAASAISFFEERKKNQQQLKESEERYRLLAENATDIISRLSLTLQLQYVSQAIERILGYTPEEIVNTNLLDYFHPEDKILMNEYKDKLLGTEEILNVSFRLRHKSGNYVWIEASSKSLKNLEGKIVEIISISRDITERVKMEESLVNAKIQAEAANRAKSVFITTMSHEIRTPLNAVLGFSDLLYKQITNPTQKNYLESIRSSGSTLLKIINDILDLSKIESGRLEIQTQPVDLKAIILDLSKIFELKTKEKNLKIIIDFSPEIPQYLYLDELRIRQILYNLINNAIKFTDSGHVKIEVLCQKKNKENIDLQLNVIDTGIGIKPESQKKIFEAFQQQDEQDARKYGGTGLGLAITKRLAEFMNGKIELKSKVGEGSCFTVILKKIKISKTFTSISNIDLEMEPIIFDKAKILITDDIKSNRDVVKGFIKDYDFEIFEAENGFEAIEIALKEKPDLILMDYKMPRMNGIEATEILRKEEVTKNTPILVITASAYNTFRENSEEMGFNSYLPKPVKQSELINELTKYLKYSKIDTIEKEKSQKFELSKTALKNLPKIIEVFENELNEIWLTLQERQPVKEVRNFYKKILDIGQKNDIQFINDYATQIKIALDSFDIESLRGQISRFNDILNILKNINKQ